MYSHSKKWVSDEQKLRNKLKAVNKTRNRMFPKSFAWPADYDLDAHHQAMAELRRQRDYQQIMNEAQARVVRRRLELPEPAQIRLPIAALYTWPASTYGYSAVLAQPTIFVHGCCKSNRADAPWPCKEELHHEGDYRISNEKHLRRMLPAPRVSSNDTVAWSKRSYLQPHPLDDFRVFRNGVDEAEVFSDEEGMRLVGNDLYWRLDPIGRL